MDTKALDILCSAYSWKLEKINLDQNIEGTSQVGTLNVFFDRNPKQSNLPMRQRFEFRQLVPGGSPINVTKWDFFEIFNF